MAKKINARLGLAAFLILGGSLCFTPSAWAATTIGNNVSIGGTLSVTGAATTTIVTTSQYISVGGTPVSFNASYSNGSLNLAGKLSVDGTAAVSSTLIVGGAATFRGNVLADVNGVPNIGAFGSAFNNIYSSGTIYGTNLNLSNGATITGAVTFTTVSSSIVTTSNYISVGAAPRSFNASYSNGSANLSGNLSVDGTAAVSSTLIVGGAVTVRGNLIADANGVPNIGAYGSAFNNVYASGTLFGANLSAGSVTSSVVTTSQYLSVGGVPSSYNASYANGSINAKNLSLDGGAAVSSTLVIGGVATFRGSILADVNGVPNIGAFGSAFNNIYTSGTVFGTNLNLTGAVTTSIVTTSQYLTVGGTPLSFNASFANGSLNAKNLSLDGTASVSSTLIVGGVATFRGNILADVNNTVDIGAYGSAFKDAYTSGTIFANNLVLNGSASTSIVTTSQHLTVGGPPASFNANFANGSINAKNLSLDGTAAVSSTLIVGGTVTFRGSLLADANGVPDIGSFGAAFNNFYSSGTIFATNISVSSSVSTTIVTSSQYLSVGGAPASFNASFVSGSLNANSLSLDGSAAVSTTLIVGGTATFRGSLLADVNGVPSLGAFGAAFNNVYASGTFFGGAASLGNLVATGTVTLATTTIPASTTLSGGVVIGDSGTNIIKHISVVVNTDLGASTAAACSTQNVTVAGAKLGDTVAVAPKADDAAWVNGNLTGFALSDDTVRLVYCGDDTNSDPADMSYRIDVWKH